MSTMEQTPSPCASCKDTKGCKGRCSDKRRWMTLAPSCFGKFDNNEACKKCEYELDCGGSAGWY